MARPLSPPFFVATLAVVGALTMPSAGAEVVVSERAKKLFREGVELLQAEEPDYRQAHRAFSAAYEDSPSPKILGNLGLTAMKIERDGEAIEAYERYLEEVGAVSDKEEAQIAEDLETLESRVAWVELAIEPPSTAEVRDERQVEAGESVVNQYEIEDEDELGIRSGRHRITVEVPGREPVVWELEAEAGERYSRTFDRTRDEAQPAPAPDPEQPEAQPGGTGLMTGAWIALGVTGAAAITTAAVGGAALAHKSDFEEAVEGGDRARASELRNQGVTLNVATDALLGVTLGGAALTTVLMVLAATEDEGEEPAAAWIVPSAGPRAAGLTAGVRF